MDDVVATFNSFLLFYFLVEHVLKIKVSVQKKMVTMVLVTKDGAYNSGNVHRNYVKKILQN